MAPTRKTVRIAEQSPYGPHVKPRPYHALFMAMIIKSGALEIGDCCPLAQLPQVRDNTEGAAMRLFIVETGGSTTALKSYTGLPSEFIYTHLQDGDNLNGLTEHQAETKAFSVSWCRLVRQVRERYQDEQRIRDGKDYDIDTVEGWDPVDLFLNHRRQYQWPENPVRPYDLIDEDLDCDNTLLHAAKECMSFFRNRNVIDGGYPCTAFILIDPVRHHRLFYIEYGQDETRDKERDECVTCFIDDRRPFDRIRAIIEEIFENSSCNATWKDMPVFYLDDLVQNVIARMVHEDLVSVLGRMNSSLDKIESVLHDNNILQHSVTNWRVQLGRWRTILFHQDRSLRKISKSLAASRRISNYVAIDSEMSLEGQLEVLEDDLNQIRQRIENTFQGLMAAMNIVESERAIMQAETVSKLTNLAFFFIPLTLVATIFGMDINEWSEQLTWWLWVVVSVGATGLTYLVLYWKETRAGLLHFTRLVTSQRALALRKLVWLKFKANILLINALLVCYITGLIIGTWRLVISSLKAQAKAAIAICIIWFPFVILFLVYVSQCFPRRGMHAMLRHSRRTPEHVLQSNQC